MSELSSEKKTLAEIKKLLDSEALVTARLVESITKTAQMASASVPEIQGLFSQWLALIGGEVRRIAEPGKELDIVATANQIGIEQSSLLSILLMLQREGHLSIETVRIGRGKGHNEDICSCLMREE